MYGDISKRQMSFSKFTRLSLSKWNILSSPFSHTHIQVAKEQTSANRYDWKSLSSIVDSICHTSALTEPIARFSRPSRLLGRGEELEMTPAELQERIGVWEEKLLFSETPRHFSNPTTRARKLVHLRPCSWANFVAGGKGLRQALEKFLQFFDKALHLNPSPSVLSCAMTMNSVGLTTRRASYERLTLVAIVSALWNTQSIQPRNGCVLMTMEREICIRMLLLFVIFLERKLHFFLS